MGAGRLVTQAPGPAPLWLQPPGVRARGCSRLEMPWRMLGLPRPRPPCMWGCPSPAPVGAAGASWEPDWSPAQLNWGLRCRGQGVGLGCEWTGQGFWKGGACWAVWDDCLSIAAGFCVSLEQGPPGLSRSNSSGVPVRGRARHWPAWPMPAWLSGSWLRRGLVGRVSGLRPQPFPTACPRADGHGWGDGP